MKFKDILPILNEQIRYGLTYELSDGSKAGFDMEKKQTEMNLYLVLYLSGDKLEKKHFVETFQQIKTDPEFKDIKKIHILSGDVYVFGVKYMIESFRSFMDNIYRTIDMDKENEWFTDVPETVVTFSNDIEVEVKRYKKKIDGLILLFRKNYEIPYPELNFKKRTIRIEHGVVHADVRCVLWFDHSVNSKVLTLFDKAGIEAIYK